MQWLARLFAARRAIKQNGWLSRHLTLPWAHISAAPVPLASVVQPQGDLPTAGDIHWPHPPGTLDARAALLDVPLPHKHPVASPTAVPPIEVARQDGRDTQERREDTDAQPTPMADSMHFVRPPGFGDTVPRGTLSGARAQAGLRATDNEDEAGCHTTSDRQLPSVAGHAPRDAHSKTEPFVAHPFAWSLPRLTVDHCQDTLVLKSRSPRQPSGHNKSARRARHNVPFKGFPAGWYGWERRARRSRPRSRAAASLVRVHAHAAARQAGLGSDFWL